jgi:LacI family transcriptional regulator
VTQKPIVFIDCYFDEGEQYNNVGLDDYSGMRMLTEYLLKLGHRDILFIGDQPTLWGVDARRLSGHIAALGNAGIAWSPERYMMIAKDRKRRHSDHESLLRRLNTHSDTVWMFISDYYAVEAIDYLIDHGIRVPNEISVTGFDDNILARIVRPRLTTVHQNVTNKAEAALRMLLDLLGGVIQPPAMAILPTRVVRGGSVQPHRK